MSNEKVPALKKFSVLFPYIVAAVSLLAYLGQHALALNLIPIEYQFIVTAILLPLAAHFGQAIPQPNLADSPYNPKNQQ